MYLTSSDPFLSSSLSVGWQCCNERTMSENWQSTVKTPNANDLKLNMYNGQKILVILLLVHLLKRNIVRRLN